MADAAAARASDIQFGDRHLPLAHREGPDDGDAVPRSSQLPRPFSSGGEPMAKKPAGTTTISGQASQRGSLSHGRAASMPKSNMIS